MMKQQQFGTFLLVGLAGCALVMNAQDSAVTTEIEALTGAMDRLAINAKHEIMPLATVLAHAEKGPQSLFEASVQSIVAADGLQYRDQNNGPNPVMGMMNIVLVSHAVGIIRIELAYRATVKVFKELPKLTDKRDVVDQKMIYILAPVKEFFNEIHTYAGILIPLVKASFGEIHHTGIDEKHSMLLTFLMGKEKDAGRFFAEQVTTLPKLTQVAYEFITFFKDLKASFSPEAKAAARKYMELVEINKQAAAVNAQG